ncbi:hypothetical protein predicted by Glimmer/Critica [Acetobacter ghanensis]|uniref:Uncharacterized protein n=1 Tax=Acetobacter ghanensis TaxID=431306 RepID=A0A0U5FZ46_9PROT|nr:hypothetical protein predicted by Glimmer/Critica [Acetobacter ghanensis]
MVGHLWLLTRIWFPATWRKVSCKNDKGYSATPAPMMEQNTPARKPDTPPCSAPAAQRTGAGCVRVRPQEVDLSKCPEAQQASTFILFDAASSCIRSKTLLAA